MTRLTVLFMLVCLFGGEALGDFDTKGVDREAASRLMKTIRGANLDRVGATVRRICERAVELAPDRQGPRKLLGYKKLRGTWVRSPAEKSRLNMLEDKYVTDAEEFRDKARRVEAWRAQRIGRACARVDLSDGDREMLLGLLARAPRTAEVHRLLGHEQIGGVWVRPELKELVGLRGEIEARWAACRISEGSPVAEEAGVPVPGTTRRLPGCRMARRLIAYGLPGEGGLEAFADSTPCSHALVRELFGEGIRTWDRALVIILDLAGFSEMIHGLHPSEEERKRFLRFAAYRGSGFYALQCDSLADARDNYSHSIGFRTSGTLVAPEREDGAPDWDAYSWVNEGIGYLVSIELHETAMTCFAAHFESSGKIDYPEPPLGKRSRANLNAWLRNRLIDRVDYPLPEVFGKSMNNLDFLASIQAWSFLRFLALYSPPGFARLPDELKVRSKGSYRQRSEDAIEAAFGEDAAELERLWRAFLLEIE